MAPRAVYVHVPFCAARCPYCNFTVVADRGDLVDRYLEAIERELSWLGGPHEVDTLFVGGGTPTQLPPEAMRRLLLAVRRWFRVADGYEWSVEANPLDLTETMADVLAEGGVNRVSLGVQSFDAGKLVTLGRDHRPPQVEQALAIARERFAALAVDLIFGVPGETLATWRDDLAAVVQSGANHVSTYGLTYERGARFWSLRRQGRLTPIDESTELAMYEQAVDALTAAHLAHYEVSNFARAGFRCRHNAVYWNGGEYFAVGPGAARHVAGRRETNHRSTTTYLRRVLAGDSPVAESEQLSPEQRAREALVFGLRQLDGVDAAAFAARTGFTIERLVGAVLPAHVEQGLLAFNGDRLRLTRRGLLVSDSIWPGFL